MCHFPFIERIGTDIHSKIIRNINLCPELKQSNRVNAMALQMFMESGTES
jgi:hypothetical protein